MIPSLLSDNPPAAEHESLCAEVGRLQTPRTVALESAQQSTARFRKPLLLAVPLCVAMCGLLYVTSRPRVLQPRAPERNMLSQPLAELWDSVEVQNAATKTLMDLGHEALGADDLRSVKSTVCSGFANLSSILREYRPEAARTLSTTQISFRHMEAVVAAVRLLGNPQVQRLGAHVADGVRVCPSAEKAAVRHCVEKRMRPELAHAMALGAELVPEGLRELWGSAHEWELTLDPENIRTTQAHHRTAPQRNASAAKTHVLPIGEHSKTTAIFTGVLEEGRVILSLMQMCCRLSGADVEVPSWVPSMMSEAVLGSELSESVSCERWDAAGHWQDSKQVLFCPVKFGSLGLDALRSIFVQHKMEVV